MAKNAVPDSVLKLIGNTATAADEMAGFRSAAIAFSSEHPRFIEKYPKQWVVVYKGKVKARGQTMQSAMLQAEKRKVPIRNALVQFIDRSERTFIL